MYLQDGQLDVKIYESHWLDTGTFEALHEASNLIRDFRKNN